MCIQLSECLPTIQQYLEKGVKEVRVVCGDVLHLDCSLQGDNWRGINLVLLAKQLRVWDEQKIDLSGTSCSEALADAGQSTDGTGMDGKDGYPGASGGNALIKAEEVIGQQNLEFISNGGTGGTGQRGGDGSDGASGKAMEETEMRRGFDTYIRTDCKPGDLICEKVTPASRRGDYKKFSLAKPLHLSQDLFPQLLDIAADLLEDGIGENGTG